MIKTDDKEFLSGASQDELVLIESAFKDGLCQFIDRDTSEMRINCCGKPENY